MNMSTEAPSSLSLGLASAVLGVSLHVLTLGLRLDNYGWRIFGLWNFSLFLIFLILARNSDILSAIPQISSIATAFLFGFFSSTSIRRLFLSPIRKFPGPWQAALTSFYRVHLAIRSGTRLFTEIDKLHDRYGDYVRIGPREVSILNPLAIPILYGPKSPCVKGPWYDHNPECLEEDKQLFLLRDSALHSWRRRIFDRGFSSKAAADYEPRIQATVDSLLKALDKRVGTPINLTDWISFFAFDAMGRIAYDRDFGMLERGEGTVEVEGKSTSIAALHNTTRLFGILGPVPWLIKMIIQTNLATQLAAFHQWCRDTMRTQQQTFNPANPPTTMATHLLSSHHHAAPTHRQSPLSLLNDSILLIIAGSDTTATAITHTLHHLARSPTHLHTLRAHLSTLPDHSPRALASLPTLDHILHETLRLHPPVCQGLVRETPPGGITIPSNPPVHIPGGTVVSVPTRRLHRDTRFWGDDAGTWRPERWEGVDTAAETVVPWVPFSRGSYACPGKAVAYAEMRAVVAGVVGAFDVEVVEGEGWEEGGRDTFTLTVPGLGVVLRWRGEGKQETVARPNYL